MWFLRVQRVARPSVRPQAPVQAFALGVALLLLISFNALALERPDRLASYGGSEAGVRAIAPDETRYVAHDQDRIVRDSVVRADDGGLLIEVEWPFDADFSALQASAGMTPGRRRDVQGALRAKEELRLAALARVSRVADSVVSVINAERKARGLSALPAEELVTGRFGLLWSGLAVRADREAIDEIRRIPGVKKIWLDREVRAEAVEWGVARIGADHVWATQGLTGKQVVVAIVDTGIDYTHPDLGGCLGPDCKVKGGYDFINNDADPMDDFGHGTHVAGIAAANGTIRGVAPDARLLAVKVLSSLGSGSTSTVIAGLEWACENGADIINMSLGSPIGEPDDPVCQAVNHATQLGVLVVASAGNQGPDWFTIGSPAMASGALTVGAIDNQDQIARFSSRGPVARTYAQKPEIVAPGVGIHSTVPRGACLLCAVSGYADLDGTSMAAPHVAGAAALMLEQRPNWRPDQIKAALASSADPLGMRPIVEGSGCADVAGAVEAGVAVNLPDFEMGVDDLLTPLFTASREFQVTNLTGQAVSLSARLDRQFPPGLAATVTPATLELPAGATGAFSFSLNIENLTLPGAPEYPCDYSGGVLLEGALGNLRIPFTVFKGAVLDVRFAAPPPGQEDINPNAPEYMLVHNRADITIGRQVAPLLSETRQSISWVIPPGRYDLLSFFSDSAAVVREGIQVDGQTSIDLLKTEARNHIRFTPQYHDGQPARLMFSQMTVYCKESGGGITLGRMVDSTSGSMSISNLSSAYRIDIAWLVDGTEQRRPVYTFQSRIENGVSSDIALTHDLSKFKHLVLRHGWGDITGRVEMTLGLATPKLATMFISAIGAAPLEQELYLCPPPDPTARTGYLWEIVGNPDIESALYDLLLRPVDSQRVDFYAPLNFATPLASAVSERVSCGTGPTLWFGGFQNTPSRLGVKTALGDYFILMRAQLGEAAFYDPVPFQLYQDGNLIKEGDLDFNDAEHDVIPIAVDPGRYRLRIPLPRTALLNPASDEGVATLDMDTRLADPNPPALLSLHLDDGLEPAYSATRSGRIAVQFKDDVALASVEISAERPDGWVTLAAGQPADGYLLAPLPAPLEGQDELRIRVSAADTSGNSLVFEKPLVWGAPDLQVTSSHNGVFQAGLNAEYTVTVENIGHAASRGTVSLTDELPTGLSVVSVSAPGWSCQTIGATVSCTLGRALEAQASAMVTIRVAVSAAAAPGGANRVRVTSGEDSNAANNESADLTSVAVSTWWVALGPALGSVYAVACSPSNPSIVYAGAWGQVFRSTDSGKTWRPTGRGLSNARVGALEVHPSNPDTVYAGTEDGLYKTTNAGGAWTRLSVDSGPYTDTSVAAISLDPANPDRALCGTDSGFFATADGGKTWTPEKPVAGVDDISVDAIVFDPDVPGLVYAATNKGIFKRAALGAPWALLGWDQEGWRGGAKGTYPRRWIRMALAPATATTPKALLASHAWSLLRSLDGGVTWGITSPTAIRGDIAAVAVDSVNPAVLYLSGYAGVFWSTDGGRNWAPAGNGLPDGLAPAFSIASGSDGSILCATNTGLYRSSDQAVNWDDANDGLLAAHVNGLALAQIPGGKLVAYFEGAGFCDSSDGVNWTRIATLPGYPVPGGGSAEFLTDRLFTLVADPRSPGVLYAGTNNGFIKTTNGGKNWAFKTAGLPPDAVEWPPAVNCIAVDPTLPGLVYMGLARWSTARGVYRSANSGENWTKASGGLPEYGEVLALVAGPGSVVFAATVEGSAQGDLFRLMKSANGGSSWLDVGPGIPNSRITSLVLGPASSTLVYVGTENGGLFRSANGGTSWQTVNLGLSATAVGSITSIALSPHDPNLILVGTQGAGVRRSRDGGQTWQVYDNQLPANWVYWLAFDPSAPNRIFAATSGGVAALTMAPDLALTASDSGPFLAGPHAVFHAGFANAGSEIASGPIQLTLALPEGAQLLDAQAPGLNCQMNGQTLTCSTAATLETGQSRQVRLLLDLSQSASGKAIATQVSGGGDVNPVNSSASGSLVVIPSIPTRFPAFAFGPEWFTGMALSNLNSEPTRVALTAFDRDGKPQDLLSNPSSLTLAPGEQRPRILEEWFQAGTEHLREGWIAVASERPVGTQFQIGTSWEMDGAESLGQPSADLCFASVCEGPQALEGQDAATTVTLVNPSSAETVVASLELLGASGNAVAAREITLLPRHSIAASLADLFQLGDLTAAIHGHLRVRTSGGHSLLGYAALRTKETRASAGAIAQPVSGSAPLVLYSAQLADTAEVLTRLKLVNTGTEPRQLLLTAFDEEGASLAEPVTVTIPPNGEIGEDAGHLFSWNRPRPVIGTLRVEADGPGVLGDVLFAERGGLRFAASLPLQSKLFTSAVFNHVANGVGYFTGIALHNAGAESAEVTVEIYAASGELTGRVVETIGAGARFAKTLPELIPATEGQAGGYVLIKSTQPLVAQEIFGSAEFYSAVPATVIE